MYFLITIILNSNKEVVTLKETDILPSSFVLYLIGIKACIWFLNQLRIFGSKQKKPTNLNAGVVLKD